MTRILIVDDEKDLVWAVRNSLRDEGYEIFTAYDGIEALSTARRSRPDAIILDIVMPRLDGLQVCHRLRQDPGVAAVPILFLSIRDEIKDRLAGFEHGADDYLVKPFDLRELRARIKALLRRAPTIPKSVSLARSEGALLTVGPLTLDTSTCQVRSGQKTRQLTPTEFDLLHHLMTHPGEVFSSGQLLQQVWGYPPEAADPSLVRWHVKNLRAKIEPKPRRPLYIRTVPRHGYMFDRRQGSRIAV